MKLFVAMYRIFILTSLILLGFTSSVYSQDKKTDVLPRYYKQGNYRLLLKKSNRLLKKEAYSNNPTVYLFHSLALYQLKKDSRYVHGHPEVADDFKASVKAYTSVEPSLASLYSFTKDTAITNRYKPVKLVKKTKKVAKKDIPITSPKKDSIPVVIDNSLNDSIEIEYFEEEIEDILANIPTDIKTTKNNNDQIIQFAEQYLGLPYRYGGFDEKGFDCSGFTSYVMGNFGYTLSRSSRDQINDVVIIDIKDAEKGDLVFFGRNKRGISHVGIVSSNKGEELSMIHSSTSRGIMYTNIEQDSYWKPKLISVGRIIKKDDSK